MGPEALMEYLQVAFMLAGISAFASITYLVYESFKSKREPEPPEVYLIPTQGPIGPPTGRGPKLH
jgi:hypothetical protein